MENKTQLQRGEESYALQVPEQVHLLCELLDVDLSRVLQVFINDLGHDLYGGNGSNERWMAIDYFMNCGYGLHLFENEELHQMFYELEQLRNRWCNGSQEAEKKDAAYRDKFLSCWFNTWLKKRSPGTMTQALELL